MAYFLPPLTPPPLVIWTLGVSVAGVCIGALTRAVGPAPKFVEGATRLMVGSGYLFLLGLFLLLSSSGLTFFDFYAPAIFESPWIAPIAIALGLALFGIRKFWLGAYGAIEILGALATVVVCALTQYGSTFERGAALLGAIYFLVRGLDNAEKGNLASMIVSNVRQNAFPALLIPATLIIAMAFLVVMPEGDGNIPPPYLGGARGERVPVSPIQCGGIWIVCDRASWELKEQLLNGTQEERDAAEDVADRRKSTFELAREHQDQSRPKILPLREPPLPSNPNP